MGLLRLLENGLRRLGAAASQDPGALWLKWGRRAHTKQQGLDYLGRAAALGQAEGLLELGLYYASGGHGPGGKTMALDYFKRSAERGCVEAGHHLAEGLRWAGREDEALSWYRRSAERGYGPSMAWLVKALTYADGVEVVDLEKAQAWQVRLDALGEVPRPSRSALQAQPDTPELDPLVRFTRAVRDSVEELVGGWVYQPWFPVVLWSVLGVLAALALGGLALMFLNSGIFILFLIPIGIGFAQGAWLWWGLRRGSRGTREGRRIFVKAFQGDPESCFQHGMALANGTSDYPKDPSEAQVWLEKAARNGHLEAMVQLADLHRWGAGGPRRPDEARVWLEKAAAAGHPEAPRILAGFAPDMK